MNIGSAITGVLGAVAGYFFAGTGGALVAALGGAWIGNKLQAMDNRQKR